MQKFQSMILALGTMGAIAGGPALAQTDFDAQAYAAGVKLGRSLQTAAQCTGNGEFHGGCVDGVQESQFDREADQAMDAATSDPKPGERAPILSPPPDLFQPPFSKPDDGSAPNN